MEANKPECQGCAVQQGTHAPMGTVTQISEPSTAFDLAQRLDDNADLDAAEGGNPAVCKLERDGAAMIRSQYMEIVALKAQLAAAQQGVQASVIAGAFFDFAGYLTTLPVKDVIHCSEANEASPMVEAFTEWAKKRGLSLADARVENWREALATPPTPQGLDKKALGQRVATLWVEESGVLDFEVLPPCTLPAGEYPLHIAAQVKQGGQANG